MANRPNHNPPESAQESPESDRLRNLLEPVVLEHQLYLEDVDVSVSGGERKVAVVVDLPENETGGVSLDAIAEVSNSLSKVLDDDPHDPDHPYELEVSSPGVSRPLTQPRHWRRSQGRMVTVHVAERGELTARLLAVDDDGVTIRPEAAAKKGMKAKQGEPEHIPFDQLGTGHVEIEFSRTGNPDDDGGTGRDSTTSTQEA